MEEAGAVCAPASGSGGADGARKPPRRMGDHGRRPGADCQEQRSVTGAQGKAPVTERLSKDNLVLGMLAVLGGDRDAINERDLFLACWHAFPNTMRWTDTALPNPDTFTASLRRLDARKFIAREGKQRRARRGKSAS